MSKNKGIKCGMIVELRNGKQYLICELNGEKMLASPKEWMKFEYKDWERQKGYVVKSIEKKMAIDRKEFDIQKVWELEHGSQIRDFMKNGKLKENYMAKLVFEGKPAKVTLKQLKDYFGFEIEVEPKKTKKKKTDLDTSTD